MVAAPLDRLADELFRSVVGVRRVDEIHAAVEHRREDARDDVLLGVEVADRGAAEAERRH